MVHTKSREPGQVVLEQGPSASVGDDGRFKICFHSEDHSLASWYHDLQMKRSCKHSASRPTSPEAFMAEPPSVPRLNIAIHIVGSRGDVQPFIPIAQSLSKAPFNHRVRICTHPVFKDFVEDQGVEFFSIGGDPEALMSYMVRNPGLLPNRESVKAGDIGKRRDEMAEIINGCWRSCIEAGNGMGDPVTAATVKEPTAFLAPKRKRDMSVSKEKELPPLSVEDTLALYILFVRSRVGDPAYAERQTHVAVLPSEYTLSMFFTDEELRVCAGSSLYTLTTHLRGWKHTAPLDSTAVPFPARLHRHSSGA